MQFSSSRFGILITFLLGSTPAAWAQTSDRPNIIVILADDLGYADVGAYNPAASPQVATPNIDSLAAGGILFTDGHCPDGVCTPTRYGLLNGRYSWRTSLKTGVLQGHSDPLIDADRSTLATMLGGEGYNTAAVGKWHLGMQWAWNGSKNATTGLNADLTQPIANGPLDRGFDSYFGISASLDMPPYGYIRTYDTPDGPELRLSQMNGDPITDQAAQTQYGDPKAVTGDSRAPNRDGWVVNGFDFDEVTPTLAGQAASYITDQATDADDSPFFLYVPFTSPHTPIVPTDANAGENPGAGNYGAFMADVDDAVGTIVAAVDAQTPQFADNTLILFTSDNGAAQFQYSSHTPNAPFRGRKTETYEGGTHVPFIARWGDVIAPGQAVDERVHQIDLYATVADIVGQPLADDEAEDSMSFLGLLDGSDTGPVREGHVYHSINGKLAIASGDWKLIEDDDGGGWGNTSTSTPWQLFKVTDDAHEDVNLIGAHPNKAVELSLMLDRYGPNLASGRSRTHRDLLVRFDLVDFQAGKSASAANPDVSELTATDRLAAEVAVATGLHKGAGTQYATSSEGGGEGGGDWVTVIDDPFDDGNIATGGPNATNGGFNIHGNAGGLDGDVSLSESAVPGPPNLGIVTVADTGASSPNGGMVSVGSIDGDANSAIRATFVVDSADKPTANGHFLGLVDGDLQGGGDFFRTEANFGLIFFGTKANQGNANGFGFGISDSDANNPAGFATLLHSSADIQVSSYEDGFTAAFTTDVDGWSYEVTGLNNASGTPTTFSQSGAWIDSGLSPSTYSAFFDNAEYAMVSHQTSGPTLIDEYDRITVEVIEGAPPTPSGDRNDEFHLAGFDQTSLADAITDGDYLSFSIEIDEAFEARDLLVSVDLWREGADSALQYDLLTSEDGFTTPIGSLQFAEGQHGIAIDPALSGSAYGAGEADTLSGLLEVPDGLTGQVEFRVYGYSDGASKTGSTHFIAARVEGLVQVPEPSTFVLAVAGTLGLLACGWRRRRW